MKIVLALFLIGLFAVVPFFELLPRIITLGAIFAFLMVLRVFLHIKSENITDDLQMRKHRNRIQLVYVLLAIVVVTSAMQTDPLRRQPGTLRLNVLDVTTIGMTIDEVTEIVNNRRRWGNINQEHHSHEGVAAGELHEDSPYYVLEDISIIGSQVLRAPLGAVRYLLLLRYEATATWIFDVDGRLIDVVIRKEFAPPRERE